MHIYFFFQMHLESPLPHRQVVLKSLNMGLQKMTPTNCPHLVIITEPGEAGGAGLWRSRWESDPLKT